MSYGVRELLSLFLKAQKNSLGLPDPSVTHVHRTKVRMETLQDMVHLAVLKAQSPHRTSRPSLFPLQVYSGPATAVLFSSSPVWLHSEAWGWDDASATRRNHQTNRQPLAKSNSYLSICLYICSQWVNYLGIWLAVDRHKACVTRTSDTTLHMQRNKAMIAEWFRPKGRFVVTWGAAVIHACEWPDHAAYRNIYLLLYMSIKFKTLFKFHYCYVFLKIELFKM